MTNPTQRVWIDTDPGHDDAMAIMLLAGNPAIEILGISTVFGNASLPCTTRNAIFILNLLQRTDLPLFPGADRPLLRDQINADVHGESGFDGAVMPDITPVIAHQAQDALIRVLTNTPEPLTILTLGPLTNIALLLTKRPDLTERIKQLIMMGGAITVPGNKSRVAEFNIFCDPESAEIVFNAPIKKVLVPLDPCNDVMLTTKEIADLSDGTVGSLLKKVLKPYVKNIALFEGVDEALMYDPISAYMLIDPQSFQYQSMDVRVETTSKSLTYGMTVAERRNVADRTENMQVVTSVNRERFIQSFLSTIKRLDDSLLKKYSN